MSNSVYKFTTTFRLSVVSASDGPLAKRLMHTGHLSGHTSGVLKSSADWFNYSGFPGDV